MPFPFCSPDIDTLAKFCTALSMSTHIWTKGLYDPRVLPNLSNSYLNMVPLFCHTLLNAKYKDCADTQLTGQK